MVQDRRIVSTKVEWEVICALSNAYVANDNKPCLKGALLC